MHILPLVVAAIAVLPVVGVAVWVWLATASTTDELRSFVNFEGMHFED
jgi:phosphoribosylcarboxyaminoimidazole (NCAIR) mutase